MAYIASNTPHVAAISSKLTHAASAVFQVTRTLAATALNASRIAREVERLNATSDAQLAAKGTSRPDEINRIFAPYSHL